MFRNSNTVHENPLSTNSNFPFDQQKESTFALVTTIITNFIFHQHTKFNRNP